MFRRFPFIYLGIGLVIALIAGLLIYGRWLDRRAIYDRGSIDAVENTSPDYGKYYRLGGFHWGVGEITITFKELQIGDGKLYLQGSYRDFNGDEKILKVLVGSVENAGSVTLLTRFGTKEKKPLFSEVTTFEAVDGMFTPGDRLLVTFLVDVPELESVVANQDLCNSVPGVCELGILSAPFQAVYGGLWYKGTPLPLGMAVNAVGITLL